MTAHYDPGLNPFDVQVKPKKQKPAKPTPSTTQRVKKEVRRAVKAWWFSGVKQNQKRLVDRHIHGLDTRYRETATEKWVFLIVVWGGYEAIKLALIVLPILQGFFASANYSFYKFTQSPAAKFLGIDPTAEPGTQDRTVDGSKIAGAALLWVNREFKPGQSERCAEFVRQVLKDANVNLSPITTRQPLDPYSPSNAPALANSFGADQGAVIEKKRDLKPGDIVLFANTYGDWQPGTITHVAIYIGNGEIVDRSTRSAPVRKRPIDTFDHFVGGVRLEQPKIFTFDIYRQAVASQESNQDYGAINPHSGALGKYQFMPDTLPSYLQGFEKGKHEQDFLNNPDWQEQAMANYLQHGWSIVEDKTTDPYQRCRLMATGHYAGWGALHLVDSTNPQYSQGAEYPSISEYSSQVCDRIFK